MYLVYFISIVVLVIAFILFNNHYHKKKTIRFFSSDYIDWQEEKVNTEQLSFIKEYWLRKKEKKNSIHSIDDLTWNDLDMDLFYSKLNQTQTSCGSEVLYDKLREVNFDQSNLTQFNELTEYFQAHPNSKVNYLLQLFELGKQDSSRLFDFLFGNVEVKRNTVIPYYLLRTILFLSIASIFFLPIEFTSLLIISSVSINVLLYYVKRKVIFKDLVSLQYLSSLVKYSKKIAAIPLVGQQHLQKQLTDLAKSLAPLATRYSLSFGSQSFSEFEIFMEYFRAALLLDFTVYHKAISFIRTHQSSLQSLYQMIGEIDCAILLGEYKKSLPYYSTPEFTTNQEIILEEIYHPLIENPVSNSINWKQNMIITGSNASGKSTFVKSVALSLLFSQTVGFSFSKQLSMMPSMIMTSMAIKDSIQQKESYFIAEIKSLKRIIDQLDSSVRCICFIDEILKGTNTIERIAASSAILNYLSEQNCLVSVASHDIELTEIMKHLYRNYHFSETITNNEILFDYKLHDGPTKTYNAILLLDHLHYQKNIIEQANHLADYYREKRVWQTLNKTN